MKPDEQTFNPIAAPTYMCPRCGGDGSCQTRNGFASYCIEWLNGTTPYQVKEKELRESVKRINSSIRKAA